jgi:hypothetical protein
MVIALGTYFDQDVDGVVARLVGEQLEDGGWNCWVEYGSVALRSRPRSGCWKGCWRTSAQPVARRSPSRLDAGVRSTSSNEAVPAEEHRRGGRPGLAAILVSGSLALRRAPCPGVLPRRRRSPDQRVDEAIQLLRSKQQPDGTWLLENTHPGKVHFALEDGDGRPSRWNTLRALRVLSWYGQSAG